MATASKGYVFRLVSGFLGILRYHPETHVEVYQTETLNMFSVCDELTAKHGGEYAVADRDQMAWGAVVYKAQGTAVLI